MNTLLRQIPKVDDVLSHESLSGYEAGALLTEAARQVLDRLRDGLVGGSVDALPSLDIIALDVAAQLDENNKPNLQRVINGTGIVLHTNLGRAPLAQEALDAMVDTARDYSNLEYCITEGKRSTRHAHVEKLLTRLTGSEAAMVVNNNAAAIMLALSAVAYDQEVIVSRGELVEIGGSFRVPDVLVQSGCRLAEIGTTNKTHPYDYERAINPSTGALLRVHTSNFIMTGFVAKPTLEELATIAKKHSLPLIEDLGSGALIPISPNQPTVADSIKAGVDVVTFSGDKLLGGPQAGLIVGSKDYIAKMKSHPLARAMRIDKLCLAALEATLRLYLDPATATEKIPALSMLCQSPEALYKKADLLKGLLGKGATVIQETSQAGGGAMPGESFTTAAVAIFSKFSPQALELHFRSNTPPIIGRIAHDMYMLDVRTLKIEDFPIIAKKLSQLA